MGAGGTGTVVEIAADAVPVVVTVLMLTGMDMGVRMDRSVRMDVGVRMGAGQSSLIVVMRMVGPMLVPVAMHGTVGMNMKVVMGMQRIPLDPRFTNTATANRTHAQLLKAGLGIKISGSGSPRSKRPGFP